MYQHFIDRDGRAHSTEIISDFYRKEGDITTDMYIDIMVDNTIHTLKLYWREEKTWDDHMGNTPCGYYVHLPIGCERARFYIDFNHAGMTRLVPNTRYCA